MKTSKIICFKSLIVSLLFLISLTFGKATAPTCYSDISHFCLESYSYICLCIKPANINCCTRAQSNADFETMGECMYE